MKRPERLCERRQCGCVGVGVGVGSGVGVGVGVGSGVFPPSSITSRVQEADLPLERRAVMIALPALTPFASPLLLST